MICGVTKDIPWNDIRADYIAGMSYGALAKKYGESKATIYKHGKKEDWETKRKRTVNAVETKTIEKNAEKIANNATKLEDAKRKLLDRVNAALDKMPLDGGTMSKKELRDSDGKKMSVVYDLLAAAAVLEKIDKMNAGTIAEDDPITKLLEQLNHESIEQ